RLVDADRAQAPVRLLHDVRADPAHPIGHLVVADLPRFLRALLQLFRRRPPLTPANGIGLHDDSSSRTFPGRPGTPPGSDAIPNDVTPPRFPPTGRRRGQMTVGRPT